MLPFVMLQREAGRHTDTPAALTGPREVLLAELCPHCFALLHVAAGHHNVRAWVPHEPCCDLPADASIGSCHYAVPLWFHELLEL